MRKTGIFSLLAISIALANILLNHYFSTKPQNPNYYLSKEFFLALLRLSSFLLQLSSEIQQCQSLQFSGF